MFSPVALRRMAGMTGAVLLAGMLAACGATPATTLPAPTVAPVVQVTEPTTAPAPTLPAPTEAPVVVPTEAPAALPASGPAASLDDELLAQGQLLFEKTAGGVGCASCHGMDARGNESIGAPDIQGRTTAQIRTALSGVQMMSTVKVKPDEIKAIEAYLKHLSTQP